MDSTDVIRRPCVTEKSMEAGEAFNKVVFEVDMRANKPQIRKAIEELFNVTVLKVNVMRMPGKRVRVGRHFGSKPPWKKAIVTLKEGERIEFFEGT